METEFSAVPPDKTFLVWNRVAPLFEKLVVRHNYSSLEDIFKRIGVDKTHLLWIAWEKDNLENIVLALLTYVYDGILIISSCAGNDIESWLDHFETLEKFAKDNDCNRIQIRSARKGWSKPLKEKGIKVIAYTYEKNL
jgi:hypothetical protein